MSDRFVVQVRGRIVGIAVRDGGGFRFFASEPGWFGLEGQVHPSLRAVIQAAEEQADDADTRPAAAARTGRSTGDGTVALPKESSPCGAGARPRES
jgi:hypothetical protein